MDSNARRASLGRSGEDGGGEVITPPFLIRGHKRLFGVGVDGSIPHRLPSPLLHDDPPSVEGDLHVAVVRSVDVSDETIAAAALR